MEEGGDTKKENLQRMSKNVDQINERLDELIQQAHHLSTQKKGNEVNL
jgi:hypothetical protein